MNDSQTPIEQRAHRNLHARLNERRRLAWQLQKTVLPTHGPVVLNDTLLLHRQNTIQVGRFVSPTRQDMPARSNGPIIKHSQSIPLNDGTVQRVAFSRDGRTVAACGRRFVHLLDLKTGERVQRFAGHKSIVTCLAFSPDGKLLASGSKDRTIRLWDVGRIGNIGNPSREQNGQRVHVLNEGLNDRIRQLVTCLAFLPDGKTLASNSSTYIRFWDVGSARWEQRIRTGYLKGCSCVAVSPDGKLCAVGGELALDEAEGEVGQVTLYAVDFGLRRLFTRKHEGQALVQHVAFSPDGTRLLSSGRDNTARVWDVKTGRQSLKLTGPSEPTEIVAGLFFPDGAGIISVAFGETVQLWDASDGHLMVTAKGGDTGVRGLAISPDGKTLATCGEHRVINSADATISSQSGTDAELGWPDQHPGDLA